MYITPSFRLTLLGATPRLARTALSDRDEAAFEARHDFHQQIACVHAPLATGVGLLAPQIG
jgi:hypothetical protein